MKLINYSSRIRDFEIFGRLLKPGSKFLATDLIYIVEQAAAAWKRRRDRQSLPGKIEDSNM